VEDVVVVLDLAIVGIEVAPLAAGSSSGSAGVAVVSSSAISGEGTLSARRPSTKGAGICRGGESSDCEG